MIFIVSVLSLLSAVCYSQIPSYINYNESNGLPSNEVYFVYQDHEGFIWISTDNGVVKFDGQDFLLYTKKNGLADNVNFSIHPDSHGRLWFRSFTGALSYFQNDSMYRYPLNKTIQRFLGKSIILSLSIDKYDSLHLGMQGEILSVDSIGKYKITQIPSYALFVKSIEGGDPLILYLNTPGKLDHLVFDGVYQDLMRYDGSANVGIVGSKNYKGKTYAFNNKYLFEINKDQNRVALEAKKPIISLSVDRSEKMWIGLQSGGVICYDKGQYIIPDFFSRLQDLSVTSVLQDDNKGYWVSTLEKGVFYFPNLTIANYFFPSNSKVNAVTFSEDAAYFGNYDGTLYKFSLKTKSFELIHNFGSPIISLFYNSKSDNLFISCSAKTCVLDIKSQQYIYEEKLPTRGIKRFQEYNGKIIGGNFVGLSEFNSNGTSLSMTILPIKVRNFLIVENDIYIVPTSGLIKTNFQLSSFDTIYQLNDNKILDIKATSKGILLATAENGVMLLHGDSTKSYYNNALPCPLVRMIFTDDRYIYMATQCGLIIGNINRTSGEHPFRIVNTRMGLLNPNIDYLGYVGKSLLSFSPDGISVIDTSGWHTVNNERFYMRKILVNGKEVKSVSSSLEFSQNNIEFRFGFISFKTRNIRIMHRPALSFKWSEGNVSQLNYNSLSPGYYQPEIKYSVDGEPWKSIKLVDRFRINPPWWESIYFLIVAALLIASIVGLGIYISFQRKLAKLKYHEILRGEKDRISRELHDNIGSRLAYIKLSLHNLNAASGYEKKEYIVDQLNAVTNDLRDTIWTINKDSVALLEFVDRVKSLTTRFQLLNFNISFNFENAQPFANPSLNSGVVFNLYRIIQEALNNSIKHSGAESICVQLNFNKQNKFSIVIKDNGVGFNIHDVNNIDGYGLLSVKARAEELQAHLEINSEPDMGAEIKLIYSVI